MTRSRSRRAARKTALEVSYFSQNLGAELLVNGDFSAWTGDNPDGWTLTGESGSDPAVSQSAADGSAGTGAARFYSSTSGSPRIQQNVGGSGTLYEWAMTVSSLVSGAVRADFVGSNTVGWTTAGTKTGLQLYAGVTYVSTSSAASPPHQFVVDQVSVKPITLNPLWTMPSFNGTHTLRFVLPVSPVIGQRVELRCRQQDSLNHWAAVIVRNASNTGWDFQLNSVSGGTATNRISVTNVGAVDAVRVLTSGSTHTAYTGSNGIFTQRGSPVSVSQLDTQTGITAVYSSAITPVLLSSG